MTVIVDDELEALEAPALHGIGPITGVDVHVELAYWPAGSTVSRWNVATWAPSGNGVWAGAPPRDDVSCNVERVTINRGRDLPLDRFRPGTCTLELYDPAGAYSPWSTASDPTTYTAVRPGIDLYVYVMIGGVRYNRFAGIVDDVEDTFPQPTINTHHVVTFHANDYLSLLAAYDGVEQPPAGANELAGARLTRIVNNAGYSYPVVFDTGTVPLQATTLAQNALTEAGLVTDTEFGALWCDRDGVLQFRDRNGILADPHYSTVQATFGELEPEICYAGIKLSTDLEKIRNSVSISNVGGTAVARSDLNSIALYRTRTYRRFDLIHVDPAQSPVIAQRQLDFFAYAANRIDALTVDLRVLSTANVATVIALALLYRIQVRRRATGFLVVADLQIQSIEESISPDGYAITFGTFNAAAVFGVGQWDRALWNTGLWGY